MHPPTIRLPNPSERVSSISSLADKTLQRFAAGPWRKTALHAPGVSDGATQEPFEATAGPFTRKWLSLYNEGPSFLQVYKYLTAGSLSFSSSAATRSRLLTFQPIHTLSVSTSTSSSSHTSRNGFLLLRIRHPVFYQHVIQARCRRSHGCRLWRPDRLLQHLQHQLNAALPNNQP